MLTKEHLEQRAQEIKLQIEQSFQKCNEAKSELEKMYGNHNALLGAQLLANQLLEEANKNPDGITQAPTQAVEPQYAEVIPHDASV